eukprot:XP_011543916.1 uncharacterized protein LOC105373133 [Homo sapiens]
MLLPQRTCRGWHREAPPRAWVLCSHESSSRPGCPRSSLIGRPSAHAGGGRHGATPPAGTPSPSRTVHGCCGLIGWLSEASVPTIFQLLILVKEARTREWTSYQVSRTEGYHLSWCSQLEAIYPPPRRQLAMSGGNLLPEAVPQSTQAVCREGCNPHHVRSGLWGRQGLIVSQVVLLPCPHPPTQRSYSFCSCVRFFQKEF